MLMYYYQSRSMSPNKSADMSEHVFHSNCFTQFEILCYGYDPVFDVMLRTV